MRSSNNPPPSPHAQAASAYGDNAQKHTPDPREVEARALLKAAKMLKDLKDDLEHADAETIEKILQYNRSIWSMFYDTAIEEKDGNHPSSLRSNILNLANFIFKREGEIMADPQPAKFDVLININREIAAGLMGSPSREE